MLHATRAYSTCDDEIETMPVAQVASSFGALPSSEAPAVDVSREGHRHAKRKLVDEHEHAAQPSPHDAPMDVDVDASDEESPVEASSVGLEENESMNLVNHREVCKVTIDKFVEDIIREAPAESKDVVESMLSKVKQTIKHETIGHEYVTLMDALWTHTESEALGTLDFLVPSSIIYTVIMYDVFYQVHIRVTVLFQTPRTTQPGP